ncbi:MAG TPA: glycoside hydrolase family 47 protein [Candidatus Sulfotelmatobacter sp.]|nr:glycoside hydrolase family 47 protein [Candidatus Sulfotelmatobacter sp.]
MPRFTITQMTWRYKFALVLFLGMEIAVCVQALVAQTAGPSSDPGKTERLSSSKDQARDELAADPEMLERVRQEFSHAWNGYKQYAWGHDALNPLSKGAHDWYSSSLLMSPVDALDTMILMGMNDEAASTREYIAKNLSFDRDIYVKNFEITIRLLGGLLSSYQLSDDKRLLVLAEDLGKRLLPAFNSPTGMPYVYVNLKTGAVRGEETNPAEVGTLLIEFGALSKLSGKSVYYEKAKRALVELYQRRSPIGLVGSSINVKTGQWTDPVSHISGGIDSYYEYLLKAWLLFGDQDCYHMWKESIEAIDKYLADQAPTGFWYGQAKMNTGARVGTTFGALDAFFPGTLALSGDLDRAGKLEASAYKMWTTLGIEPEEMDYRTMKIVAPAYVLRPEIIESAYYLHYFTHDPRYREMGKTFLDSLIKYCRTDVAYAALSDVEKKTKKDEMESFFFAETLKYLYLLYAPQETIDLKNIVFNTEAHPIRKTW